MSHLGRGSAVVGGVTPPSLPAIVVVSGPLLLAADDGTLGPDGGRGRGPVVIVAHVVLHEVEGEGRGGARGGGA